MGETESRENEITALMEELSLQARTGGMKTKEAALATLSGSFDSKFLGGNFWPEATWIITCDGYREDLIERLKVDPDKADQLIANASKAISFC